MKSPACAELDAHLTRMDDTRATIEAARRLVRELDDRSNAASAAKRSDEAELAAIRQTEADDIVACGRSGNRATSARSLRASPLRSSGTSALSRPWKAKRPEVERPLRDDELTLSVLTGKTEALIAAVVAERADDVLAALVDAREKAARAEAAARTLAAHVVERRWLPLAEKINVRLYEMPHPSWDRQPFPAWDKWTAALAHDTNAAVPR